MESSAGGDGGVLDAVPFAGAAAWSERCLMAHGQSFRFDVGERIRSVMGDAGVIEELSPGYPWDAYIILVEDSRYSPIGSRLAIHEHSMLKVWDAKHGRWVKPGRRRAGPRHRDPKLRSRRRWAPRS